MQRTLVKSFQTNFILYKARQQVKPIKFDRSTMVVERATTERADELRQNYDAVLHDVKQASQARTGQDEPTLVAVSKLKPASDLLALYEHGVRHFGENYPQELIEKAQLLPTDIKFHFIGALQSNKAKMLGSVPNLHTLETLTSIKSASILSKTRLALSPQPSDPLAVYLQINTSGEESKSGLAPLHENDDQREDGEAKGELVDLVKHILQECPGLRFEGLMTIGSIDSSKVAKEGEDNPDFATLTKTRDALLEVLKGLEAEDDKVKELVEGRRKLKLSMGMSDDFVQAIKQGSDNVRVGSRIFGARPPRSEAKV